MKIYIASDHIGVALKQVVGDYLQSAGHVIEDIGPHVTERVNYTDFAMTLCETILKEKDAKGILICGTGIGMSMMSNRHKGIRAAVCTNEYMAEMTVRHNNANILCLGSRVIGSDLALSIVRAFFAASYEGGRHELRVKQLDEYC